MRFKILIFVIGLSISSFGAEFSVRGRNYTHSCGYFTSQQGDIEITFRDTSLPWGSSVTVITGWEGRDGFPERRFNWRERAELTAQASAPYTWTVTLSKVLHERTEACLRDSLDFLFKISSPGNLPRYVNGGTPWGYYRVKLFEFGMGRCVTSQGDLPNFDTLTIQTVERN